MGVFQTLFGGDDGVAVERKLVKVHCEALCQMGSIRSEALSLAESLLRRAKVLVNSPACRRDPPRRGDFLLEQEHVDPTVTANLKRLRAEGVTDDDIRYWWNMQPLEAAFDMAVDENGQTACFMAYLSQGMTDDKAAAKLWRGWAQYCYNEQSGSNDDRPIPIELRNRVMRYIDRQRQRGDVQAWQRKMDAASSFNALVRAEIRSGNV